MCTENGVSVTTQKVNNKKHYISDDKYNMDTEKMAENKFSV